MEGAQSVLNVSVSKPQILGPSATNLYLRKLRELHQPRPFDATVTTSVGQETAVHRHPFPDVLSNIRGWLTTTMAIPTAYIAVFPTSRHNCVWMVADAMSPQDDAIRTMFSKSFTPHLSRTFGSRNFSLLRQTQTRELPPSSVVEELACEDAASAVHYRSCFCRHCLHQPHKRGCRQSTPGTTEHHLGHYRSFVDSRIPSVIITKSDCQ